MVASHASSTGDLACNPGMYPDWESNQRPFGSQAGTQSTEPYQPGLILSLYAQLVLFTVVFPMPNSVSVLLDTHLVYSLLGEGMNAHSYTILIQ